MRTLARAGLLGLATGARSSLGIAAEVTALRGHAERQPERALGSLWAKGLFGVLALTEMVADKLPATPSRLDPPGLIPRAVLAGAAAVLAAREDDEAERALSEAAAPSAGRPGPAGSSEEPGAPTVTGEDEAPVLPRSTWPALALALAASVGASYLGHAWRGWAADRLGRDWPGALLEDAAAVTLAAVATRA